MIVCQNKLIRYIRKRKSIIIANMSFLLWNKLCFLVILSITIQLKRCYASSDTQLWTENLNISIFKFYSVNRCRKNEFYDLDYFTCSACTEQLHEKLHTTADKFSCTCPEDNIIIYDPAKSWPKCVDTCALNLTTIEHKILTKNEFIDACVESTASNFGHCQFRYVRKATKILSLLQQLTVHFSSMAIYLSSLNLHDPNGDCNSCDPIFNFRYQRYCIENALLKPFLHYNNFWQATTINANAHFGDLKFVAFFCQTLHNATACNQLANLCVQSHYSLNKNSPCSAFLLTQVSDVLIKYANTGQQQTIRAIKPLLFYKKGKSTVNLLTEPIEGLTYKLLDKHKNRLQFFATTFALNGHLKRWGAFSLAHINLCQLHIASAKQLDWMEGIHFGEYLPDIECQLTLENLIDLSRIYANDNFMNIYLNFTHQNASKEQYLMQLPVLIETLLPENQRNLKEDWQLVKRFQLFEAVPNKQHLGIHNSIPIYEDGYKLHLYHSLRYVESFNLHYDIHADNHINVPIIKLRYRQIDFIKSNNISLQQIYTFKLRVSFSRINEDTQRQLLIEFTLPILLFVACLTALISTKITRKRHGAQDICDTSCLYEFLLRLCSNISDALLISVLIIIVFNTLEFLTQQQIKITLPLIKQHQTLNIMLCLALLLKLIFMSVHLWRISHYELFLIDWERPRSCDNNHFNLKCNLETSSVCSSVRTYIAENNVSAWRILFVANEWLRLSTMQKCSTFVQCCALICLYQLITPQNIVQDDVLQCFSIILIYGLTFVLQMLLRKFLIDHIFGEPLQKFIDLCSLANVSVFTLLESNYGFYVHGRSPYGFSDTDMSSMIIQLQREAKNMCGRRGLLSDSDKQTYIILPPGKLRIYLERLLIPYQRSYSLSQSHYQKEINTIDNNAERTTIAYASVNRFFCAFIDHAIKDMDYIIKEKTLLELFFNYEMDNYITESKGTFYIDNSFTFGRLTLLGNSANIFCLEFLILLTTFILFKNLILAVSVICFFNLFLRSVFRYWVRCNVSNKTLIDKRFLM